MVSNIKTKSRKLTSNKKSKKVTRKNSKYHASKRKYRTKKNHKGGKKTVKKVIITSSKKSRKKKKINKVYKLIDVSNMKGGSGRQLNELMNRCYEFFEYQDKRESRREQHKLNAKKRKLKDKFKDNLRKSRRFVRRLKLYRNDIIRENYPHREDIQEYLTIIEILSMFRNTEQLKDVEAKYKFQDFLMTNEFYKHLRYIYNDKNFEFSIKTLSDRKIFKEFNKSIKMVNELLKSLERMDVIQFCQIIERYRDQRQLYKRRGQHTSDFYGSNYNYSGYGVSYV